MVGVPKSQRCTFCKGRKTKCDEKWPTCGTCARAGKICSGPRKTFKFISNGNHRETADCVAQPIETSRLSQSRTNGGGRMAKKRYSLDITIVDPKTSMSKSGYHVFTNLPKRPQSTHTDRIISRLVACLNVDRGTGHDLRILGGFIPSMPQHLGDGNTTLDHAVELLIDAWTNSRRGLPSITWLNLRIYNKALRSLKTALDDDDPNQLTRTLAALCILQKTEVLYDFARGSNQENHAAGLIAVVNRNGPEHPIKGMVLHVLFEGFFHMLQEDIRQGRDSDFHSPQWMTALRHAIDTSDASAVQMQLYHAWVVMTAWPGLARLVSILRQNPWNYIVAAELHQRATVLAQFLKHQDDVFLASLIKSGAIVEIEDTAHLGLFPKCYHFADFPTAKLFCAHASFVIITCRFLQEAAKVLGTNHSDVETEARRFSERIWMAYPWVRGQTPLGVDYTAGLVFSYESGNKEEREFCIASLGKMDAYRRPAPIGEWVEGTVLANAKAYSGRLPFIKTQDPRVEYDGIGCRS